MLVRKSTRSEPLVPALVVTEYWKWLSVEKYARIASTLSYSVVLPWMSWLTSLSTCAGSWVGTRAYSRIELCGSIRSAARNAAFVYVVDR